MAYGNSNLKNDSNNLAKNSIYNSVSTVVTVAVPLLFYPYVTRVLGPTNFGKVSFAVTLTSYFMILSTLGINNYAQKICAFNANDKKELSKSVNETLIIAGFFTAVSFICYNLTISFIKIDYNDLPLYIIFGGMILLSSLKMDWLLVSKEHFAFLAIRNIFDKFILLIGCFTLVNNSRDFLIMGGLYVLAYAVLPAVLNYGFIIKKKIINKISFRNLSIKKHLEPIIFLSLVTIGSKIFSGSDILMLRFFEGDTSVGIYNNAIKLPLVLDELLMAIAAVVTPRLYKAVKDKDEKEVFFLINYASNTMFFFAVPAIITCIFFPNELLGLIAGKEYLSGSKILVVYSFIMMTTLCLTIAGTRMFIARCMERMLFYFLIVAGAVNIVLNIFLIPLMGGLGAAVASVVSNSGLLIAEIWYLGTSKYLFDKDKLKYLLAGLSLIIVFFVAQRIKTDYRLTVFFIAILIGSVLYPSFLLYQKEATVTKLLSFIQKTGSKPFRK